MDGAKSGGGGGVLDSKASLIERCFPVRREDGRLPGRHLRRADSRAEWRVILPKSREKPNHRMTNPATIRRQSLETQNTSTFKASKIVSELTRYATARMAEI
jgi:hypothetical protein